MAATPASDTAARLKSQRTPPAKFASAARESQRDLARADESTCLEAAQIAKSSCRVGTMANYTFASRRRPVRPWAPASLEMGYGDWTPAWSSYAGEVRQQPDISAATLCWDST